MRRDRLGGTGIQVVTVVLVVLGAATLFTHLPEITLFAAEVYSSGDITFTDSTGSPLYGEITISTGGESQKLPEKDYYIGWASVPDTAIYFNALATKNASLSLKISGDSLDGRVIIENYGASLPENVNVPAPGVPIKYVEVGTERVSFSEVEVTIQYSDAELIELGEKALAIYRYDSENLTWNELVAEIDEVNNTLSTKVYSLSIFAVSGKPEKIEKIEKPPGKIEKTFVRIDVLDAKNIPVVGDIKTYDEAKTLRKEIKASALLPEEVPDGGELEIDALANKNVAVKLKISKASGGEVILDDYGKNNPVSAPLPGRAIKFVEVGASNIAYSSAEVIIHYTEAELEGADESTLVIYHWNGAAWEALATSVDLVNNLLTASTTFLSPFGVSATGGIQILKVQTNRFSVFSPWLSTSAPLSYVAGNLSGVFTAYALLIDTNGMPISGANITFEIYSPAVKKATLFNITRSNGLANVSYNTTGDFTVDGNDVDYGTWNVTAYLTTNPSLRGSINLSIQAGGEAIAGCGKTYCHNPSTATDDFGNYPRSPYTEQYNVTFTRVERAHTHGSHDGTSGGCYYCHPGYSPANKTGSYGNTSDVHRNRTCDYCHGTWAYLTDTTATGGRGIPRMPSCTDAGCHPLFNRNLTNISSLATLAAGANISVYSLNFDQRTPLTGHNGTGYSFNLSVPCIVCHGPAHNNTKPEPLPANTNNITEFTQCTSCHNAYQRHNNSVNCTVCHSQDAHIIKVFAQNATYINESTSSFRGNCTNCHQNSSFLSALLVQPKAGAYTGRAPPQIPVPMNHSNDVNAGRKWNTTPGYWTNGTSGSAQNSSCLYCHGRTMHNTSALGRPSLFRGGNTVNSTITASTSWCASCHWQGYSSGANTYNDTVSTFNFPGEPLLVPPDITGNASFGANQSISGYTDHSTYAKDDASCKNCHGSLLATGTENITLFTHSVAVGVSGGANCTNCHDAGKTPPSSGGLVNFTAMNSSDSIHKSLNINAASPSGYPAENKRCWACHGNGSEPPANEHPSNYRTPYNCTDCHVISATQSFNFTPNTTLLNVTQHYWNGTNITTYNATTCYACHNRSGMMLGSFDPDGTASVYSGANGGNNSTSHYGKKRNDLVALENTTYCRYCHSNGSTVFPFIDDRNKTIINHSTNYNATNPGCADCHNSGRLHNSTLFKQALALPNSTYCTSACHGTSGTASKNNLARHNGTLNCTQCHLNDSRSIHPVRYLEQDGLNWSTSNATAANCTHCHQSGLANFSSAPIIPSILRHSSNLSNGSIWNSTATPYWISSAGSCYYCHNNTKHNSTALGRISSLLSNANNTRNGSLAIATWCADCHYNTSNPNYKGEEWTPVPPLITVNNTGKSYWRNHSTFLSSGYKDSNCETCHALNGTYLATSLNYSHSLNEGISGGPNCISCHNYGETEAQHRINNSVMNSSSAIHKNLNSNAANSSDVSGENKKCWGCHDSTGTQPPSGSMGDRYTNPYRCYDCHNATKPYANVSTALNVSEHFKDGEIKAAANASDNSSSCLVCHNLSEMLLSYTEDDGFNSSYSIVSHYGIKRSDLRTWDSGNAVNCSYCHQNGSTSFAVAMLNAGYNSTIANHSRNNSPTCYNSTCHASGWLHNSTLARPALPLPNSTYCQNCHAGKQKHNDTVDCSNCHINSTSNDTIHPIKYIQRNGSFATTNTTAANCTSCHQGTGLVNFSNATIIPTPLNHSTDSYSGGKWGSYWGNNSIITACYYCHQNDTHKAGAALLGNVSFIKGSNIFKNSNLSSSTWCANCHYAAALEYNGTNLTPPPPEITNSSLNASDGTSFYNHSGFTNYNDSSCKTCHGAALAGYSETTLNFSHSLSEGGGGPDCISCHDVSGSGAPADKRITASSIRQGVHRNLNSNATNSTSLDAVNKACWACHGDGTEPVGHPSRYKTPRQCSDNDCHSLAQSFRAPMVHSHFKDAELNSNPTNATNFNVSAEVSCETCHSNSRSAENGGMNASVSHYATRDSLIDSMNCIYCHLNRDNSRDWGNATEINKNRSGLIEFDRLRNKFTAYSDEFVDLGAGYRMRITGVSPQRGSAIIELYKGNAIVDIGLVNIGRYVYEETRMVDNASSRVQVIVLNITSMFVSDTTGFIQFEGFRIKRVHPESRTTSCYLCHFEAGVEKHKYTVTDRRDDYVYYTEVFANSSDRNEYDQQEALRILANKTPLDIRAGIERPKRKTLVAGEKWMLAQNYILTLEEVAENRDSARFLLEVDGNRFTDVVKRGEVLSYEMSINYLGYVYTKIVVFSANVSEISANFVVLEDILALSPEIKKIKDNASIYGYNASWLWENNTFMTGAIPLSLHAPLLHDGRDGGAACTTCHSVGELGAHEDVNFNAASTIAPENKPCWACHGDGKEPKWHPANYKNPRDCKSCHSEQGITYNATYIGDEKHGALMNCEQCHVSDTHKIIRFSVQPGIRRLSLSKQEVNAGERIRIDATAVAGFEMRIRAAEYYIDSPVNITPLSAADGSLDEQVEEVTGEIDTSGLEIGNHTVYVRAMERSNKWGPVSSVSFAVTGKAAVMADTTRTAVIIMVGIFAFSIIIIFVLPLLRTRFFS